MPKRSERRPALLLDRDGTVIRDAHYLKDPSKVSLLPGAVHGLSRFQAAGWPLVIVTNQSGIARGMITPAEYEAVRLEVERRLRVEGITLTATFHCPHHPDVTGACACRKPGTLLYAQARDAHGLDLAASVFVGDRWRDIAGARAFGGRAILVPSVDTPAEESARAEREEEVAPDLDAVADLVLGPKG